VLKETFIALDNQVTRHVSSSTLESSCGHGSPAIK